MQLTGISANLGQGMFLQWEAALRKSPFGFGDEGIKRDGWSTFMLLKMKISVSVTL